MGTCLKQYDKDYMKMAMLKQEETFRQQVHELHRLYKVQKLLMNDTKAEIKRQRKSSSTRARNDRWNAENETDHAHQQNQGRARQVLNLELPAEEYIEEESDLELTLATGGSRRRKNANSFTSDSGASFSSSSTESGGVKLNGNEWGLFQVPDVNIGSYPRSERKSKFNAEEQMISEERVKRPGWPVVSTRSSPSGSRPSSPRSYAEGEGYNSADEQGPCFVSSYDDTERERMFEIEIRRTRGLEVKRMLEDGNCLFRAVADQVYGDPETYDMARQMCIDYMEQEGDHFSQFITEGFASYCKRKRRDKVYGNNVEIQAFCEMYNRPIHIYCYSTEPINIFHGSYNTDTPPIRLSFHHGNHYNSLVDPRRVTIGAGLGFSSLRGTNIDRDQVKAVIRAQQDQQIDNALLAEGRFYSDLELTEKEIERMVIVASRAEYLAEDKLKQQLGFRESSTSGAEPSSSGARTGTSQNVSPLVGEREKEPLSLVLSSSMQIVLSMGFSYLQMIDAYSIFGDDVDSMICYLLEMGSSSASPGSSRLKGKKATE